MDDIRLIQLLALLAECVREMKFGVHDEKPLPHLQRAIAIAESNSPPEPPSRGDLYRQMGIALKRAGQLEAAADTLRRSIAVFAHLVKIDDETFCVGALARTLMMIER